MIFIQKFVIEARVQDPFNPRLDFADVDQHAVGRIDLAGENKISDVVAPGPIARGSFGPERGQIFGLRPTGNKEATRSGKLQPLADRQQHWRVTA